MQNLDLKIYFIKIKSFSFFLLMILSFKFYGQNISTAMLWNKELIKAIRRDFARPPVHARNLFHLSVAMHDAWAAYEPGADTYFLGKQIGNFTAVYLGVPYPEDLESAKQKAISYASYRLLRHRFLNSPGAPITLPRLTFIMDSLGYDIGNTSTDYINGGPAEFGNFIANRIIAWGYQDGSNEINNYANQYYVPVNPALEVEQPGNPNMTDPNRWQAISLSLAIDQSGNVLTATPPHLAPEWGNVQPFALPDSVRTIHTRDGNNYKVYRDPGAPPYLDTINGGNLEDFFKWNFTMVSIWQSHLDTSDNVIWDISPASIGNIQNYPTNWSEYQTFYNFFEGGDAGTGRTLNPITNLPYSPQFVKRGDYARVLAEFWADGLDSETPAGHWFAIYNKISKHPMFIKQWNGQGPVLNDLEYDVKAYLTLSGAMHDAAITAWGIKGWYDYLRPVSALRYMAEKGQSSNPLLSNYHPAGLPLIEGFIEVVELGDQLAGMQNENVGKIKLYTWKGPNYIDNPEIDMSGVGWILAENWWPYQRPTFVTPPFAGYISGHSTFSSAAAEALTQITGSEYFPGGMSDFVAEQNEFLHFEQGPSQTIILQWATYKDASDQCSLSRIWGGIHPAIDDIPGRIVGKSAGSDAFEKANELFLVEKPVVTSVASSIEVINNSTIGDTLELTIMFSDFMNISINPTITFLNTIHPLLNSMVFLNSEWVNNQTYKLKYIILPFQETINDVFVQVKGAKNNNGVVQEIYVAARPFIIDKQNPSVNNISVNNLLINDTYTQQPLTISVLYNERCNTSLNPQISFTSATNLNNTFVLDAIATGWVSDFEFVAVYNVQDNNQITNDIGIEVIGAKDLADNLQENFAQQNFLSIDTQNPLLINFNVNEDTLNIMNIGSSALQLNFTFNKEMNTSLLPEIVFDASNILGQALILNSATWIDSFNYRVIYNLQNLAIEVFNININIQSIVDLSGNSTEDNLLNNVFSIDTQRPEIFLSNPSANIVSDSSLINGFTAHIIYSEKMNTYQKPLLQVLNNGSAINDIVYNVFVSNWINDTTFNAVFNIQDNNIELEDLSLSVNFASDFGGNAQLPHLTSSWINIDTKNPQLQSLLSNAYYVSNSISSLEIVSIFNEPLNQAIEPQLAFMQNNENIDFFILNTSESGWLNAYTYKAVYNFNDTNFVAANISVNQSNAFDLAGNFLIDTIFNNYFEINYQPSSTLEMIDDRKITISPNPVNRGALLFLNSTYSIFIQQINIYSSSGAKVYEQLANKLLNHANYLPTIELNEGLYIIEILSENKIFRQKLIVTN